MLNVVDVKGITTVGRHVDTLSAHSANVVVLVGVWGQVRASTS